MIPHLSHVMTLANSIIGVSVLAMPFCFKQCGIVLAVLVLLISSVLSRLASHFLIKSAVMSRRRNFEFLAFHAFGTTGKLLVELFIIGFLLGTCVAFFVVVGDLGPQIVGKMLNKKPDDTRTSVLVTTAAFIVLPLGLLRNIDSLSSLCTATIGFYLFLVLKVIGESTRHILLGDWYRSVVYWRPAGVLQCLPIFSMALFCQTQLFEIYEAIPNVCLEKMNQVVRGALNICTAVYLCVGFFGYVAFCNQPFTGNILMSFEPSLTSDVIKMGFVFSVAFSFPLVIFPCRASLNSLLFRRAHGHEPANNYIPEVRFRWLTLAIVSLSLGIGILIPNIEFLLGIVGSTIGVMICLIFPAAFFIAISTKNTNERLIAQGILFLGMWIMVLCTYANIYAMEESSSARVLVTTGKPILEPLSDITFNKMLARQDFPIDTLNLHSVKDNAETLKSKIIDKVPEMENAVTAPAIIPAEITISTMNKAGAAAPALSIAKTRKSDVSSLQSSVPGASEDKKIEVSNGKDRASALVPKQLDVVEKKPKIDSSDAIARNVNKIAVIEKNAARNENLIDSDAIKKEETELAAAAAAIDSTDLEAEARREKLLQTLEKHKLEQLEMMEEQKELLKDIKERKEEFELEKRRLADEQRQNGRRDAAVKPEVAMEKKIVPEISGSEVVVKIDGNVVPATLDRQSHGPILSALTNWSSLRDVPANKQSKDRSTNDTVAASKSPEDTARKTIDVRSFPPIALRMSEKTGKSSPIAKIGSNDRTANDENTAMRRDILEHRSAPDEPEKREKREIPVIQNGDETESIVGNGDGGRCVARSKDNYGMTKKSPIESDTGQAIETKSLMSEDVQERRSVRETLNSLERVVRENSSILKTRDLKEAKRET